MTIKDLKTLLSNNKYPTEFCIFQYPDNTFLVDQYIAEISTISKRQIVYTESLAEATHQSTSLLVTNDQILTIIKVDTLTEAVSDFRDLEHTIVVCNKIDKKVEPLVASYVIEFPKLLDWQILDYMRVYCPNLEKEDYIWLYNATSGDIYKIKNELDKLNLFSKEDCQKLFNAFKSSPSSDLYTAGIFDLTEAIVAKDKLFLSNYLKHQKALSFDPIAIINILLGTYKKIAYIHSGKSTEALGISSKQAWAISKRYFCSPQEVFTAIKFLSNLDLRLKDNKLDANQNTLITYVISNLVR